MVWARRLALLTGNGVRATGAVVSLTLAGLAAGAALAGRRADRIRRPLLSYAVLEAAIGLWGLATLPLLAAVRGEAWAGIWGSGSRLDLGLGEFLLTALIVGPGALLMGCTTPLLVRTLSGPAGVSLGRLAAWNTLGGATGAVGAVLAILPALGNRSVTLLAAGIDFSVALGAWGLSRSRAGPDVAGDPIPPLPAEAIVGAAPLPGGRIALLIAGGIGAAAQIAWTRILSLLFGTSIYALGLTLGAVLTGLALGSGLGARALRRGVEAPSLLRRLLLSITLAAGVSLPAWGQVPILVSLVQDRFLDSLGEAMLFQAALSLVLVVPMAALFGALLPVLTAGIASDPLRRARDAGRGFSLDTLGSVAGGLVATYLLLPALGADGILRATGVAAAILLSFLFLPARGRRLVTPATGMVLAAVLLLLPGADRAVATSGPLLYGRIYARSARGSWSGIAEAMHRRGRILFYEDGADATVTVREGAGIRSLQINGKTDASTGGDLPSQILAGQLPALLHPYPRTALLIGLASGTTARSLARHPLSRIDCVEISPSVVRAARLFEPGRGGVLEDPRFHLFEGDGRILLARREAAYDLIVSQPTNPWIAGVATLFTGEFFRLARRRLAPDGLVAVWLQGYALSAADFRSVAGTFLDTFPHAELWEDSPAGGDYFLIGSAEAPAGALIRRADRIASPRIREDLARAGVGGEAAFLERLVLDPQGLAQFSRGAPRITDDNRRLEFSAPRGLWLRREDDLLAALEALRRPSRERWLATRSPPPDDAVIRRLQELERDRRVRIRLALSTRETDLDALASPALSEALARLRAGSREAALPFLRQARREAPDSPAVALLLGWLLLEREDLEEAGAAFEAARKADPGSAEAENGLGLVRWRRGEISAAEIHFQRAVDRAPENPEAVNNLASVLLAEGQESRALPLLDRALGLDPDLVAARINRGVALARLGRLAEAIRAYDEALRLEPGNADALYNRERARERLGTDPGESAGPESRR